ncbi:MAG: hypothetical protein PHQ52_07255 [Candidatus Omnitrophica bacterium]|nr:hypothetical protein [Candidatus Omnitrophota bacterium]
MNSSINFIYKLEGPAINDGIDVFDLSPLLLNLGNLITETNKLLYPKGHDIGICIKPFQQGSFVIDINICQSILENILDFASNNEIGQIKEVLIALGLIASNYNANSLLEAIVFFIRNFPNKREQVGPNQIKYTAERQSLIVTGNVDKLLFAPKIINYYNKTVEPLSKKNSGIEQITTYIKNEQESTEKKMGLEQFKAIQEIKGKEEDIELLKEEITVEAFETEKILFAKRGSYDGDPKNWSFTAPSSEKVIQASIKDELFLEYIKKGEIRFNYKDALKVLLVQKVKKINGIIDPDNPVTFEIKKVLKIEYYDKGIINKSLFD